MIGSEIGQAFVKYICTYYKLWGFSRYLNSLDYITVFIVFLMRQLSL